jgi:hypothetical protein
MFDLILNVMHGFSAKIGSTVPLGRGYFPNNPRHFVPGYYRAVPPGQIPFALSAPGSKDGLLPLTLTLPVFLVSRSKANDNRQAIVAIPFTDSALQITFIVVSQQFRIIDKKHKCGRSDQMIRCLVDLCRV